MKIHRTCEYQHLAIHKSQYNAFLPAIRQQHSLKYMHGYVLKTAGNWQSEYVELLKTNYIFPYSF